MAAARKQATVAEAPSRGLYFNSGTGPSIVPIDIGHKEYIGLIDPDTAFWSLVKKEKLADTLTSSRFISGYKKKSKKFADEMNMLRFGLKPTAVYFNSTEQCNLNCAYCYIPGDMRKNGRHMTEKELLAALAKLKTHFRKTMPKGRLPQIIFHGAEPMLNREAVFRGIEKYRDDFQFGIQTNATLLDDEATAFLTARDVSIGLSLDGHTAAIADKTRTNWTGKGVFAKVEETIEKLKGYHGFSVICTITSGNMRHLSSMVDYLHARHVPNCLLNIVRCTLPPSLAVKPADVPSARHFLAALDRSHELYKKTGRKLVVANFANILISILAPTARRLMCDISPCGGGRAFFALAPNGDLFPCSEFVGLARFNGGNLFKDGVDAVLESEAFKMVTERKVEDIKACGKCAIRHFCGSPCPAEAHEANGGMKATGSFCEFYEEQTRYALRAIADGKDNDYLWDGWDKGARTTFDTLML
ncbi:MAG: peptide-modifying radical SAM enzyme CbpB [Nitrospinae bacterium]|nr:peptide-modifying radical SAM enzyme CbpB [Nitrospinota bacterium]